MLIIYHRAMLWPQVRLSSGESKPVEVAWPVNEPRIVSHHGQGATHLPGEVPSPPAPCPRASCAAWGLWGPLVLTGAEQNSNYETAHVCGNATNFVSFRARNPACRILNRSGQLTLSQASKPASWWLRVSRVI